jgi:hypothetical protein
LAARTGPGPEPSLMLAFATTGHGQHKAGSDHEAARPGNAAQQVSHVAPEREAVAQDERGVARTATPQGAAAGHSVSAAVSVSDQEELAQAGPERAGGSDGRDVRRVADGIRAAAACPTRH